MKCGREHRLGDCTEQNLNSVNFKSAGIDYREHMATDINCPIYDRKLKVTLSCINLGTNFLKVVQVNLGKCKALKDFAVVKLDVLLIQEPHRESDLGWGSFKLYRNSDNFKVWVFVRDGLDAG